MGVTSFAQPRGSDGFDPAAFEHLAALEESSFWFRSRNRLICWALQRYFPRARSVLEIGCGTGYVLSGVRQALPQARLVGSELHAEGLEYAQRRLPEVELLQFDARRIPFDGEFDVVGAFDVLEHIEEDEAVLAEIHRALRGAGGMLLTVPQHPWLWSAADEYAEHKRRYRRSELIRKVTAAGFAVRRITSFVTIPLPAMAAARVRDRRAGASYDPTREHQAAARATGLLERVLGFERSLIERGANLPVGGSLLMVASA